MTSLIKKSNLGVSTVELGLLMPLLFIFFLSFVQFIIYLLSANATQLAAFAAARSFQVYGDGKLAEIDYPHVQAEPNTHAYQTIAEAAAERVIFESLMWEHSRILSTSKADPIARVYHDGAHHFYQGMSPGLNPGSVQVKFIGCRSADSCNELYGSGVEVFYCLPIVFPGARALFHQVQINWPCQGRAMGRSYHGVMISRTATLGREPIEG